MVFAGDWLILDWSSTLLSLVVNIFATGLIARKAWNHHHIVTEAAFRKRTRAQNILLLLIESGTIYCVIQLAYTASTLCTIYADLTFGALQVLTIVNDIFIVTVACYPVAVIILINKDQSPVLETLHTINGNLTMDDDSL
ncbi:hypothetical protein GYMLUDRAFT_45729 [Collybiopsis luxurians FD-317 M1]|uniref:Uncharacterized protein n=1 Tax=Collybiopsis luxurians FD-317 M1 TaxID=944289 RepID=A0A0D0CI03_9AGAR|nr:hypothetical protein GYMLUDRAFT_45729 [Collybiopsis luxurians FD-317 M1]